MMVKRKREESSTLSGRNGEVPPLKEKKEEFHPLLEEMHKNERIWFRYHMKAKQIMQTQGKLLRAHWRKVDRIAGKVPTKKI